MFVPDSLESLKCKHFICSFFYLPLWRHYIISNSLLYKPQRYKAVIYLTILNGVWGACYVQLLWDALLLFRNFAKYEKRLIKRFQLSIRRSSTVKTLTVFSVALWGCVRRKKERNWWRIAQVGGMKNIPFLTCPPTNEWKVREEWA